MRAKEMLSTYEARVVLLSCMRNVRLFLLTVVSVAAVLGKNL